MAGSLDKLVRLYVMDLRSQEYAQSTIDEYVRLVRQCLSDYPDLENLCRADVLEMLDAVSTASKRRWRWLALRSFGRFLVAEGILAVDPTARILTPKEKRKTQPILSDDALDAMLATCESRSFLDLRNRAILLTLASTGCRRIELVQMMLDDLDIEAGTVEVQSAKGGKPRTSFLDTETRRALLRYLRVRPDGGEMLWVGKGGKPLETSGVKEAVDRQANLAGVKATPHMFRRRLAAAWLHNGGSEVGLMKAAGWKNPLMPSIYAEEAAPQIAATEYERMFPKEVRFRPRKKK